MTTYEQAVTKYQSLIYHAARDLVRFNRQHEWSDIAQEGFCWLGENLDAIERWETGQEVKKIKSYIYASVRRYMVNYLWTEDYGWTFPISLVHWAGDDGGELTEDEILSFGGQIEAEHGPEAEFTEDEELYRFRVFLAVIANLKQEEIDLLADVFIRGMSYSDAARKRGQHVSSTSVRCKRIIEKVLAESGARMDEHPKTLKRLHSGSEGFGGLPDGNALLRRLPLCNPDVQRAE